MASVIIDSDAWIFLLCIDSVEDCLLMLDAEPQSTFVSAALGPMLKKGKFTRNYPNVDVAQGLLKLQSYRSVPDTTDSDLLEQLIAIPRVHGEVNAGEALMLAALEQGFADYFVSFDAQMLRALAAAKSPRIDRLKTAVSGRVIPQCSCFRLLANRIGLDELAGRWERAGIRQVTASMLLGSRPPRDPAAFEAAHDGLMNEFYGPLGTSFFKLGASREAPLSRPSSDTL